MAATPPDDPRDEPRHVSFVARLQRHFGKDVDPRIRLQSRGEEPEVAEDGRDDDSQESGSGTSRGLFEKLSSKIGLGIRYQSEGEIARGGMGTILRVWDEDLRRNLAMKVMTGSYRGEDGGGLPIDEEKLGRFLEEAQITGQLDHPGIVPVHDLGIDDEGRLYFTMRLVRGRELKEILDLTRRGEEGWTITRALGLILKVCEAMAFAHSKGVVHRDLKPSNVMVGRFGEVYVMDWGLARVLGHRDDRDERLQPTDENPSAMSLVRTVRREESETNPDSPLVTMDGDVVGTPSFMAIEQARGRLGEVGPRSDVYSLGTILYYMLTGRAPYVKPGERCSPHTVLTRVLEAAPVPASKFAKDAPAELVAICEKAMQRDPDDRYESMLAVADDIEAYLENRVVRAYEGGAAAEFRKWVARNRGMAIATGGVILIALASAIGFAWQQNTQLDALSREKQETALARDEAERNAEDAQTNLDLALERKAEADRNFADARVAEQLAQRSEYLANLVAADYSLQLNDVTEARKRLNACEEELRGWEWDHLSLVANSALHVFDSYAMIDDVAFTPDGGQALYLSRAGRVRVHEMTSGAFEAGKDIMSQSFTTFVNTPRKRAMSISPDGTRVAIAGLTSTVQVFDIASAELVLELPTSEEGIGHTTQTSAIAYDPSGESLASASVDGEVIVWDAESGAVVQRLLRPVSDEARLRANPDADAVHALAWGPFGDGRLATGSEDGVVRVWNVVEGSEELLLQGHMGPVFALAWSPGGELVASASEDRMIMLWDAYTGRQERTLAGHRGAVHDVDFHPTDDRLVSASEDGTIRLWQLDGRDSTVFQGHEGAIAAAAFSPDGRHLLSGAADQSARLWEAHGELAATVLLSGRGSVDTALDPRGEPRVRDYQVGAVAFRPGGRELALGGDDELVSIWDADSAELLRVLRGHTARVAALAYSPDGSLLVSTSFDKTARLWNARTGGLVRVLEGHEKWVSAVAFSPDGAWFVTGSGDQTLRVWDAGTGELLRTLPGHSGRRGWITSLAVDPTGKLFASAAGDKRIHLWSLDSEEPLATFTGHTLSVSSLCFSPDGARLVSGSMDRTVRTWFFDAPATTEIYTLSLQTLFRSAYTPDGKRFATGSSDGRVLLWDVLTGEALLKLEAESPVNAIDFDPDGKRLLCGAEERVLVFESEASEERRLERLAVAGRWDEARALVERLFAEHFYLSDVLVRLESDSSLAAEIKETAIRAARIRGDDAGRLDEESRRVVLDLGSHGEELGRAVRRSRAACELDGRSSRLQCTLGIGLVRLERYEEGISALLLAGETDRLDRTMRSDVELTDFEQVLRLCYLAMAYHGTGDAENARRSLTGVRYQLRDKPELGLRQDVSAAFGEAELRIETVGALE